MKNAEAGRRGRTLRKMLSIGENTYTTFQGLKCCLSFHKPDLVLDQSLLQGADFAICQFCNRFGVGGACFLDGFVYLGGVVFVLVPLF